MPDHNDKPKPEGKLSGVQFMPGVSVSVGGKHTSISYWDRKKLVEDQQPQDRVHLEERRDGSVRITTANGFSRIVDPWAIAWRLYEPEGRK